MELDMSLPQKRKRGRPRGPGYPSDKRHLAAIADLLLQGKAKSRRAAILMVGITEPSDIRRLQHWYCRLKPELVAAALDRRRQTSAHPPQTNYENIADLSGLRSAATAVRLFAEQNKHAFTAAAAFQEQHRRAFEGFGLFAKQMQKTTDLLRALQPVSLDLGAKFAEAFRSWDRVRPRVELNSLLPSLKASGAPRWPR